MLGGERDRETRLALAQLYEKAKKYTEMARELDAAEKLAKNDEEKSGIYFMRGAMYERMKKFDLSEAEFRKVLQMDPENAGALNYLGYMLADRNVRLDEAFQLIKKAVDQDPNNGAYLDSLGWVYYRQGKLSEAEGVLVKAVERPAATPPSTITSETSTRRWARRATPSRSGRTRSGSTRSRARKRTRTRSRKSRRNWTPPGSSLPKTERSKDRTAPSR